MAIAPGGPCHIDAFEGTFVPKLSMVRACSRKSLALIHDARAWAAIDSLCQYNMASRGQRVTDGPDGRKTDKRSVFSVPKSRPYMTLINGVLRWWWGF